MAENHFEKRVADFRELLLKLKRNLACGKIPEKGA
jgi:hypothetical protein